jgi:hypothetical protein
MRAVSIGFERTWSGRKLAVYSRTIWNRFSLKHFNVWEERQNNEKHDVMRLHTSLHPCAIVIG